jgi:hypothetical protein
MEQGTYGTEIGGGTGSGVATVGRREGLDLAVAGGGIQTGVVVVERVEGDNATLRVANEAKGREAVVGSKLHNKLGILIVGHGGLESERMWRRTRQEKICFKMKHVKNLGAKEEERICPVLGEALEGVLVRAVTVQQDQLAAIDSRGGASRSGALTHGKRDGALKR